MSNTTNNHGRFEFPARRASIAIAPLHVRRQGGTPAIGKLMGALVLAAIVAVGMHAHRVQAQPTTTPTPSTTPTPTNTPTITPTLTPTNTPTITPTVTPTFTPTITPTGTLTSTLSPTLQITATITPYATPTPVQVPSGSMASLVAMHLLVALVAWLGLRSTRRH